MSHSPRSPARIIFPSRHSSLCAVLPLVALVAFVAACGPTDPAPEGATDSGLLQSLDSGSAPHGDSGILEAPDAGTSPDAGRGSSDSGVPPADAGSPSPDAGSSCTPACTGRACGPDGCGGTCGRCPNNSTCEASGAACACDSGFVPSADFTSCVPLGGGAGNCGGYTTTGSCLGDTWVHCDPLHGLVALGCGSGQCLSLGTNLGGACACGAVNSDGLCLSWDGQTGSNEAHYYCGPNGVLEEDNCKSLSGSASGLCETYVSSFGNGFATACYCSPCDLLGPNNECLPICSGLGTCVVNPAANTVICQ